MNSRHWRVVPICCMYAAYTCDSVLLLHHSWGKNMFCLWLSPVQLSPITAEAQMSGLLQLFVGPSMMDGDLSSIPCEGMGRWCMIAPHVTGRTWAAPVRRHCPLNGPELPIKKPPGVNIQKPQWSNSD